jgi:hypothetical protein
MFLISDVTTFSKKKEIVNIGGKPRVINVIYMDEL